MKAHFSLAAALVCAVPLTAQITAVLNRFPGRSSEVEIRNNAPANLMAFAISMAPVAPDAGERAPFLFFADAAVDADRLAIPDQLPLAQNREYSVPVTTGFRAGHRLDLFEAPIVTAGVFADGTTAGDPALLARLMLRRSNMLQAVELAREILSDAGGRNVPRGQLIEQFRMLADSVNHWYLPPEQQVGRALDLSIAEKLSDVPPLQAGSPFPPTAFVEMETTMLNRRRATLLESQPHATGKAIDIR